MSTEPLVTQLEEQVLTITFQRPKRKNALTLKMYELATAALEDARDKGGHQLGKKILTHLKILLSCWKSLAVPSHRRVQTGTGRRWCRQRLQTSSKAHGKRPAATTGRRDQGPRSRARSAQRSGRV